MFKLVNYPNIQTGVELDNPWFIGGCAVLGIALVLLGVLLLKRRKHTNEKKTEE